MIRDHYEDGQCPDCKENIPKNAAEGSACKNCGHVFFFPQPCDDAHDQK